MFEKVRRGQSSYIAAFNNPILDDDILRVPRVKTVSIDGVPLRCRGGIHIEVGHRHIFRVCNERVPWRVSVAYGCCGESSPKLRLSPRDPIDKDVLRFPKSKADGTASHVRAVLVHIIPLLAVAVEERLAMSTDGKGVSTQPESRRTLCICDADTILRPIADVIVPGQLSLDANVTVLKVQNIHNFGDSVVAFGYLDLSVLTALLESVHNVSRVIFAPRWRDGAEAASFVHASQSW